MGAIAKCYNLYIAEKRLAKFIYGIDPIPENYLFQQLYINKLDCKGFKYNIKSNCLPLDSCDSIIEGCREILISGITAFRVENRVSLSITYPLDPLLYNYEWGYDSNIFTLEPPSQINDTFINLSLIPGSVVIPSTTIFTITVTRKDNGCKSTKLLIFNIQ